MTSLSSEDRLSQQGQTQRSPVYVQQGRCGVFLVCHLIQSLEFRKLYCGMFDLKTGSSCWGKRMSRRELGLAVLLFFFFSLKPYDYNLLQHLTLYGG